MGAACVNRHHWVIRSRPRKWGGRSLVHLMNGRFWPARGVQRRRLKRLRIRLRKRIGVLLSRISSSDACTVLHRADPGTSPT